MFLEHQVNVIVVCRVHSGKSSAIMFLMNDQHNIDGHQRNFSLIRCILYVG